MTTEQVICSLKQERDAILTQLASDATTGLMPSDSFSGQSVDFVGFRDQLSRRLKEIDEQLQRYEPYVFEQAAW